jgi:hydrogenase maturation factor
MSYRPGKLDPRLLSELLSGNRIRDPRVVLRPAVGEDVCAIDMGDRYLVAKTDPITFATDRIGWYVVQVNANDLATVGARPRWFLCTALLPERGTDEALVRAIWADLTRALESIDCALCGGHTEITIGLDRPILVGQMLGEVARERLVRKTSARPGDRILLTKGVPVEGTAIMARERGEELRGAFSPEVIARARDYLEDPGIGVLREAMAACDAGGVHAMHDPTEGGVATGLWELTQATGLGVRVEAERIPILEPGGALCRHFGLDPLGTISSGSLLIVAAPDRAEAVRRAVEAQGVRCTEIGEMQSAGQGAVLVRGGRAAPMPTFTSDEITRLWGEA